MSQSPAVIIDQEAIENLRALGDEGDDTFLREIIGIYLEDVPQRIADLKGARASDDRALYVRSAHTIKGSSANVGAVEMKNLSEKIEHRAKVSPLSELDSELDELQAAFVRAKQALQPLLA
ncbi:MAG: Hpt domain-containing protein [Opitutaceae bacterium]|jgi:HPt (histidine-containing phosphotransfer) domain-containing protein|nr:Hpt domain-containing protein [Opitutaceae bacterium]